MAKLKKESIFISIALIVLGVLFVVFPQKSTDVICYLTGGAACVWGIIRIISYFKAERTGLVNSFGFAQGAALLIVGIIIVIRPSLIAGIITLLFGVVMVVDGVLKVQYAIDLARAKQGNWIWVAAVAAVMIGLGVVSIVNPFSSANTLMRFLGIILALNGISDIVVICYLSHFSKAVTVDVDDKDTIN